MSLSRLLLVLSPNFGLPFHKKWSWPQHSELWENWNVKSQPIQQLLGNAVFLVITSKNSVQFCINFMLVSCLETNGHMDCSYQREKWPFPRSHAFLQVWLLLCPAQGMPCFQTVLSTQGLLFSPVLHQLNPVCCRRSLNIFHTLEVSY